MVVEVPLPNDRAGQTIAPRVSSSQPPLVLAWRTSSQKAYRSNSAASDGRPLVVRLAHHPGHAVVRPPTAGRLSAWHCASALGGTLRRPPGANAIVGPRAGPQTIGVIQTSPTRSPRQEAAGRRKQSPRARARDGLAETGARATGSRCTHVRRQGPVPWREERYARRSGFARGQSSLHRATSGSGGEQQPDRECPNGDEAGVEPPDRDQVTVANKDSTSLSGHVPAPYVTRRVRPSRTEPTPQPAQSARRRLNINWLMLGGPPRSKANTISPTGSHPSSPS